MVKSLASRTVAIGACGTCMDSRGYTDEDLEAGIHHSSMAELAAWTLEADRVVSFQALGARSRP